LFTVDPINVIPPNSIYNSERHLWRISRFYCYDETLYPID